MTRAQRLSASKKESRLISRRGRVARVCSTPFGIEEGITCVRIYFARRWGCAQRLSASKKESPLPARFAATVMSSAQRLSASKKESQPRRSSACALHHVLNAFRHRRRNHVPSSRYQSRHTQCSTPFGIEEGITRVIEQIIEAVNVLNAFRHRRRNHSLWILRLRRGSSVLNAFRHRRRNHSWRRRPMI